MLFLNKLLPVFVLPLGLVLLLLGIALWRKQRWPVVAAILLLYMGSIPFVGNHLIGWLETRYTEISVDQVQPADAVVVLGGILGPRPAAGALPNWLETVERFDAGLALIQSGKAGRLVFTGARMPWDESPTTEGEELRRLAIVHGIAPERILVTREIANTADEAQAVAELTRTYGWKRVIVVTTGWHMPRASLLFRKAGVDFLPFPVDLRNDRTHSISAIDFVPKAEAWLLTETTVRECYGYLFYRFFR